MNGEGEGLLAWSVDLSAALLLGSAVWFCAGLIGEPLMGVVAGCPASQAAFGVLRAVRDEPRRFAVGSFGLVGWEEALTPGDSEPLLLDDPLPTVAADSGVVRLFPEPRPLPSVGDLKRRIDAHLEARSTGAEVVALPTDAGAALRSALAELRQSLR